MHAKHRHALAVVSATLRLFAAVCSVVLVPVSLRAQAAPAPQPTSEQLSKFDKDGDGKLSAAERAAMESATVAPVRDEEAVVLSPFEVVAESHGYFASNTMSGTRLNARIEDLGAAISIVTKQQLVDTAALDINDVFKTEIGTEGTNQYTEQFVDFQGRVIDNVQANPYTSNRVRGLAAANITTDGFTSTTRIPFDAYNLDSIEISRGPNSSLSGLGDAGGTVNLNQSRANLNRSTSQVVFRGDDWGGYRSSFDLNRPLLKNKLAIRAAGLYDSKGFRRKPAEDIQKRFYTAITYKPFSSTTLSGSFESYRNFARRPNASTPVDMVSDWLAAGRPTWDPITSTAKLNGVAVVTSTNNNNENSVLPRGLGRDSFFDNFPSMFIEPSGQVVLYTPNRLQASGAFGRSALTGIRLMTTYSDVGRYRNASSAPAYPLDSLVGVSNREIYDYENINAVAPNFNRDQASLYKVQLEQRLLNSPLQQSYAQVAWRLEDSDNYNHNLLDETTNIYIDVNERLLDGTPNPFFLRPYVNAIQRTATRNPIYNDTIRGQLTYALDLRQTENRLLKFLGRHQAIGYYELNRKRTATHSYRDLVASNVPWVNPANRFDGANTSHGTITNRYYLGDAVQPGSSSIVDYAPAPGGISTGTYNFHYASNVSGNNITFTDLPVEVLTDAYGGGRADRTEIKTWGGTLQSFFLDDRLVTTVGYRNDFQRNRNTTTTNVIDPTTGFGTDSNLNTFGPWTEREGATSTYQAVVRPFKGWSTLTARSQEGGFAGNLAGLLESFQLQYSHADSFRPAAPSVNLFGGELGNPHGVGDDYGFSVRTPDEKFVLRMNWYKTKQFSAQLVGSLEGIVRVARDLEIGPPFLSLQGFARNVITARPQYANASEAEILAAMEDFVQLPRGYYNQLQGRRVTDANDQLSKGMEIELNYNPSRNLTFRLTATQTKAMDLTAIDETARFVAERVAVWSTITNDAGQRWWDVSPQPANLYRSQIVPNLLRMTTNLGRPRPQNKEWSWNALANYRFTQGRLNGLSIGSTVRWADKSILGYYGITDTDGVVRELNYDRPVYDPARASFDFMVAYNMRLFKDKVRARIQLNCKDAFLSRGLRMTSWQPEGYPATFRIIDGRQWVLSTTFDL